jgi:hypothetical protein
MLNDRGKQPENSHDDEAGTENQRAVRKIEPRMQTSPLEVSVELSDSEPKPDQSKSGPNPRHQRTLCRLAVAFPREFVGKVRGKRPVTHRLTPQLARRTACLSEPEQPSGLVMGITAPSGPFTALHFDYCRAMAMRTASSTETR